MVDSPINPSRHSKAIMSGTLHSHSPHSPDVPPADCFVGELNGEMFFTNIPLFVAMEIVTVIGDENDIHKHSVLFTNIPNYAYMDML